MRSLSCSASALLVLSILTSASSQMINDPSVFCENSSPSLSPPSSAHSLRPGDVSVLSVLGLATAHRSDQIRILNGLAEILTTFNSNVTTLLTRQRSLLDEVEHLALFLNRDQWKLILLFVPVDELCVCSGQAGDAAVDAAVQRVEEALDHLHEKLNHTLVHVVVWAGQARAELNSHDDVCECQKKEKVSARTQTGLTLETDSLMARIQESVDVLLQRSFWWSDREDFSAVLQDTPTYSSSLDSPEVGVFVPNSSPVSQDVIQLWRKLLQPMKSESDVEKGLHVPFPCPSVERPYLYTQSNSQPRNHQSLTVASKQVLMGTSLSCTEKSTSPSVPTSVHALRPGDIKVVATLGGSFMTQSNSLDVLRKFRGLSRSINGDLDVPSVTTLASILRQFNPSLTGYSMDDGEAATFLDQATAGTKSKDLVSQARVLIARMKEDSRIDYQNDWKVITVFIGWNDLCDYCSNTGYYSNDSFASHIREALDILHQEVPRAFVNLVEMLYIVPLQQLQLDSRLECPTWFIKGVCPCVVNPAKGSSHSKALMDIMKAFRSSVQDLVSSGRFDTHNFTVTLQPFFQNVTLPVQLDGRPDLSLSAADCFHLSRRSLTLVTHALWNNMLEPVGSKTTSLNFMEGISVKCPSKSVPFLATYRNSKSVSKAAPVTPAPASVMTIISTVTPTTPQSVPATPISSTTTTTIPQSNPATPTTNTPTSSQPVQITATSSTPTNPPSAPNWGSDFLCTRTEPSETPPTSVHRLRPGDIKVVASLGDSLTAGFGAKAQNIVQLPNEERGVSWCIGGDETLETVTTIPNILKQFNPNVFGFSRGRSKRPNGLNMAVSGAKASAMPGQVKDLIEAMRNSTKVDFQKDWKLVTLFIGGNDLCQYCQDRVSLSPKKYIEHIKDALDILYREVPRVLVNVVEILQIEGLRMIKSNTFGCTVLQPNLCPCFLRPGDNSEELVEMKRINRQMQTETERLVYRGCYDARDDFAIVLQPFFQNTIVPMATGGKPDLSFFSADCFHFSERGHAEMAIALWNNMLEPVGSKQAYNNFTHDRRKIHCPTEEHPFIFTLANTPGSPLAPNSCQESVSSWVAGVLAVAGAIFGVVITWLLLHYRNQRKRKTQKMNPVEMKETVF